MWDSVTFCDVLTVLVLGITGLVAYFGWQRAVESKFNVLNMSVNDKFAVMEKSFDVKFTALALQINTIMMRDVESIQMRITAIESDAANIHKRYHQLTNDLNGVGLKVDRLERPRT